MPKRVFRPRHSRKEKRPTARKNPVRPSISALREIMKRLVTTDEAARFSALASILQWYDRAFDYAVVFKQKGELTPEQAEAHAKAVKARAYFIRGGDRQKRLRAGRASIRFYEVVCSYLKPPCVDEYFYLTPQKSQRMQESAERAEEKFSKLIYLVENVLKPTNHHTGESITLKIASIKEPHRIDPELNNITIRRDIARAFYKNMHIPGGGILPTAIALMPVLTRACSLVKEIDHEGRETGQYREYLEGEIVAEREMLSNLAAWAATYNAPKRLVRLKEKRIKKTSGEKGTFKGIRHLGGEKVAGIFAKGSACAILYDAMKTESGIQFRELQKLIDTDVASRLRKLARGGQKLREQGKVGWDIIVEDDANGKWARLKFDTTGAVNEQA